MTTAFDLSYRPQTYWPEALDQEQLLSRIQGQARRDITRQMLLEGGAEGTDPMISGEALAGEDRRDWGLVHPHYMGGEYLPQLAANGVEIARVSLASTTSDQISIRAAFDGEKIIYAVCDEYETEFELAIKESEQPLTLKELIDFIDASRHPDDEMSGGLLVSHWEANLYYGDSSPAEAVKFAWIQSAWYPELADYYEQVAEDWRVQKENELGLDEDEDEEEEQLRPEVLEAMRKIATIADRDADALITDREISFTNIIERTTITASAVNLTTVDGLRISERIDIRTALPEAFSEFTPIQIAVANTMATTGAIVRDPDDGSVGLISSLPVFEEDTSALEDLYTLVVTNGALVQIAGPIAAAKFASGAGDDDATDMGYPDCDKPSFWTEDEFKSAEKLLRQRGVYCNAGQSSLTAEFPWEEGASSALLGESTSLMRFQSDMPHPVAGSGLFFRLDLPITLEREELADFANYLNLYEVKSIDTPPFFGAWCSQLDNGTLTYVGFWPNFMFQKGTVANIAFWCGARSWIARQAIGNR